MLRFIRERFPSGSKGMLGRLAPIAVALGTSAVIAVAVHAAAPSGVGSLSGTTTQVRDGETATLNTLTFQDIRPAQLTAANDLFIQIPETINAVFDTTVTTVTLGGTATSTDPQVSYIGNRIVRTNTTTTPAASSTLSITGLKIIGTGVANTPTALQYSIDGGAAYGDAAAKIEVIGRSGRDITPPGSVSGASAIVATDQRSVTLRWTNPTDSDFMGVRVYRSNISQTVGTLLDTSSSGMYTDTTVTAGMTYYYLLRAVDTSGYEDSGLVEVAVTVTAPTPAPTPTPTPTPTPSPTPTPTPAPSTPPATFPSGVMAGDLVRGSMSAVYFVAADGKRYVFPDATTYMSWYTNYDGLKRIADDVLSQLPLGGMVKIRPGTVLVKIVSDPKVYAVGPGGSLHWVENEATAVGLYGNAWAVRVRDLDTGFFAGYTLGNSIAEVAYPAGSIVKDYDGITYYYVDGSSGTNLPRQFTGTSFVANRFNAAYLLSRSAALIPTGTNITGAESAISWPVH